MSTIIIITDPKPNNRETVVPTGGTEEQLKAYVSMLESEGYKVQIFDTHK